MAWSFTQERGATGWQGEQWAEGGWGAGDAVSRQARERREGDTGGGLAVTPDVPSGASQARRGVWDGTVSGVGCVFFQPETSEFCL